MTNHLPAPSLDDAFTLIVPRTWTPQQALAVADFLDLVVAAIWRIHRKAMDEIIEKEEMRRIVQDDWARHRDSFRDDDIPF